MNKNKATARERFASAGHFIRRYIVGLFLIFLLAVYGVLSLQIYRYNQVEPSSADVTTQLQTAGVPRIDEDAIAKIQQLQDNSVNVQTLFEDARTSPFQE